MLEQRTFNVVFVSQSKAIGFTFDTNSVTNSTVKYNGDELRLQLSRLQL